MTAQAPAAPQDTVRHTTARLHLATAATLFFFGLVGLAVAWSQLVVPDLLGGNAAFSYGRLRPAATHLLVFGGLVPAVLGLAAYAAAAAAGRRAAWGGAALLGWFAIVLSVLAGTVGILAGDAQGFVWFDAPLYSDVGLAVGLALAAASTAATLRGVRLDRPGVWFLVGSTWWLLGAVVIGNIEGVGGVNASIQNGFAVSALLGPGIAGGAIGAGYLALEALLGRPLTTRLGWIGFWSLSFFAPWVGQRFFVHGPGPDWLETIAVVFSFGLFLPVLTVLADWVQASRPARQGLADSVTGRLLVVGGIGLAIWPLHNLVMALRTSGAVVQFTAWTEATFALLVVVIGWVLLTAGVYARRPHLSGRAWVSGLSGTHFWLAGAGVALILGSAWLEGLQQGYGWLGAVNGGGESFGEAFRASVEPLEAWAGLRAIGVELVAVAALVFLLRLLWSELRGATGWQAVEEAARELGDDEPEADTRAPELAARRLVWSTFGLLVLAATTVMVVPWAEAGHTESSLLAEERAVETDSLRHRGLAVYIREGCFYCHTQQVRGIVTDVGLGPVSQPGDYALDDVPMGVARIGPDLAFAGRREPTNSQHWVLQHLMAPRDAADPDVRRPWSNMPSYAHLSQADLEALAAYVVGLE